MKKRSLQLFEHNTSLSLEAEFWEALTCVAREENLSLLALLRKIDAERQGKNFASAVRVYALRHFMVR